MTYGPNMKNRWGSIQDNTKEIPMDGFGRDKSVADVLNELTQKDAVFENTPAIKHDAGAVAKDSRLQSEANQQAQPLPHQEQFSPQHMEFMKRMGNTRVDRQGAGRENATASQRADEGCSLADLMSRQQQNDPQEPRTPPMTLESVTASIQKAIPEAGAGLAQKLAAVIVKDHS